MKFTETDKERIVSASQTHLREVIEEFVRLSPTDKKGTTYVGDCPHCKAGKSLLVTPNKQMFGCKMKCGMGGKNGIQFLLKMGKTYPEALTTVAELLNIVVYGEAQKPTKKPSKGRYLDKFLASSGLKPEDVRAEIIHSDEHRTSIVGQVFKSGTLDKYGKEDKEGEDVIIEYYDLDGKPMMYEVLDAKGKPTGQERPYVRVRYQYPEEHPDKEGKAVKYRTPRGAGSRLYIPQALRKAYQNRESITRLFIQEGEKKAEKCCKHGVLSAGISGIQNIGQGGQVPPELVRIIQQCNVKEVVLLFDSDWDSLSSNLTITDDVQKRPRNFFFAARNFQAYIKTLKNRGLYLEMYIAHVLPNAKGDKGIDDLLVNTLAGNEQKLSEDINTLLNEKNLKGEYLQMYKITMMGDLKLAELWALDNPHAFAHRHIDVLKELPEFKIGKHQWRFNDKGELENTRPIEPEEMYWSTSVNKQGTTKYEFCYVGCMNFLQNRGFGRMRRESNSLSPYFVHITPPTLRIVEPYEVRDYVVDFTKAIREKDVLEMLFRGGPQYLGADRLSNLDFTSPLFHTPDRYSQMLYFGTNCWKITEQAIEVVDYTSITHLIWEDMRKDFKASRLSKPMISATRNEDNTFTVSFSEEAQQSDFLQFLVNTSNFSWKKKKEGLPITPEEESDNVQHLVAKLCAIGYMLSDFKDSSTAKAVIAMDGLLSEVGTSNGRSGKSIIGEMFKRILPTITINGKTKDIEGDNFLWTEVTEKTRIAFIDDIRTNFNLEFLYTNITGEWTVNYKGGGRVTYPFSRSPKLYITTNHAINGENGSTKDRQWLIAFSDYYNDKHKPTDDFGRLFFDEWDYQQWNLLWNLVAECVQLYYRFGVVQAPGDRLDQRRWRQEMGESFLMWAEEYFSDDMHLNTRIVRRTMYDDFLEKSGQRERKYITPPSFKTKIEVFCKYKGFNLNPLQYDPITRKPLHYDKKTGDPILTDKAGGVEYFTIGTPDYHFADAEGNIPTPKPDEEYPF